MNNIHCPDLATFIIVCAGLVRECITFRADADSLIISTTGGF